MCKINLSRENWTLNEIHTLHGSINTFTNYIIIYDFIINLIYIAMLPLLQLSCNSAILWGNKAIQVTLPQLLAQFVEQFKCGNNFSCNMHNGFTHKRQRRKKTLATQTLTIATCMAHSQLPLPQASARPWSLLQFQHLHSTLSSK